MSRWSNPFVSAMALCVLLTGCASPFRHKTPSHPSQVDTESAAAPAGAAPTAAATVPNAAAPAATPVPERAAQQYSQALQAMKAGRTDEAASAFKQLAAAYPAFAGPEVNLGLIYERNAHLKEAEAAFRTALERNPNNAIAANELGIVERRLGKFQDAEAAYQRTIAADPNYAPAYLNLGVLYDLYLAEPQKALAQFEHYIELAGENKQVAGWVIELRKRVGAPAAKKEPA